MESVKIHCVWHIPAKCFALKIADEIYNLTPQELDETIANGFEQLNEQKNTYELLVKNQKIEFTNQNSHYNLESFKNIIQYLAAVKTSWGKSSFSKQARKIIGTG